MNQDPFEADDSPAGRILRAARRLLFESSYSGLTMEALAHEIGMSKKTIYAHFASKDAIIEAILDRTGAMILEEADALLRDPELGFTRKLRGVLEMIGTHLGRLSPAFLRDLERFAPRHARRIDELRGRNVPRVFGAVLRLGVEEGMIRPDVDLAFAVEFWIQALNGLMHPDSLARTGLLPRLVLEKAMELFFLGLLTQEGRDDFSRGGPSS